MAFPSTNPTSTFHERSISLPSRTHPLIPDIEDHLCRLTSNEATISSCTSMSNKLSCLRYLYDCLDDMLQLPQTQKQLAHVNSENWADELLNSSLCFLDVCDNVKDALMQMKEQVQELQSILRRRRGDESELMDAIKRFLTFRKKSKKVLHKFLKNWKSKCTFSSLSNSTETTFTLLRKAEIVSFSLFESLLSFICGAKAERRLSSLSLITKIISSKETGITEFDMVDAALSSIHVKTGKLIQTGDVQMKLRKLESSIQDLEEELDCLMRRIIKTRAFLLNILNQ